MDTQWRHHCVAKVWARVWPKIPENLSIYIYTDMERVISYKIFRQYVAKRQRQRLEWRKTKYVLLKHIQTNISNE